jgi:type IV pilus assembly protein PilB
MKPKLGELLVQAGVIDEAQLKSALGEQRQWGRPLGMTLVRMGFVEEDALISVLAHQLKLPVVKLSGKRVTPEVLAHVPADLAEKHRCIPLLVNDEGGQQVLYLGMEDPVDLEALDGISFRLGEKVKPVLVAPSELDEAIERHYHPPEGVIEVPASNEEEAGEEESEPEPEPEFIETSSGETHPPENEPPATTAAESPEASQGGVPPEAILRALSQLLVEKGIITREELVSRLRTVVGENDGEETL